MKISACFCALLVAATPVAAQVAVSPSIVTPASWERYAIRVFNQTDTPTVAVRVEVPEVINILGVDNGRMWPYRVTAATDSTPQSIEWRGGPMAKGDFREFAFFGRLKADSKQEDLVFPIRIERQNGSVVEWRHSRGEAYAAPRVEVAGTVRISAAGQMMMAGLAIGIGLLALVVAIAGKAGKRE